ncbi:MAG: threonine synthase [Candidatus Lokiarchaeota archaeon]|nr:threonine synthase [Candidatus Lokiarchaeota archaeon]
MILKCIECAKEYPIDKVRYECDCGSLLDVIHNTEAVKEQVSKELFDKRLGTKNYPYNSGVWRYKELILPVDEKYIVTRPEGNTNLYKSEKIARFAGLDPKLLFLKHEGENPTGSFKDRGMTTGVTQAKFLNSKIVACASTGNTSASMAAFAAVGNLKPIVFIPEGKIAYGKLAQALAYGANTIQIRGNFDDAMALVKDASLELNLYLLNSVNPFRLEGQKTIIIEMIHQMNWDIPDWIIVPGGNLGNSSAFGKALNELREVGLIERLPRIAVIQAENANPLYLSYLNEFEKYIPVEDPDTIATAIKIGDPVNYKKAVRTIRWTNGVVEQVSDNEIMNAKAIIDGAGIGAEPASCSTIAGLKKLISNGIIKNDEKVCCILTGNLLKDPDATVNYHMEKLEGFDMKYANKPIVCDADYDSVKKVLKNII